MTDLLKQARDALAIVRHRDPRWHSDDIVSPAIAALDQAISLEQSSRQTTDYQSVAAARGDVEQLEVQITDVLIDGLKSWNPETVKGVMDLFRPYLRTEPEPVSLEKCAEAVDRFFELTSAPPENGFKPEQVAKAVLDSIGVKYE